jgi:hypothetical protein
LAAKERELSELTAFEATAASWLTAQHIEIENLPAPLASHSDASTLASARPSDR